jgi:phosphinothricin acetyltransferase
MKIGPLKKATKEALLDVNRLMMQLRRKGDKVSGTPAELRAILENKNATILVAQDGQRIVGVGTLYVIQKIGKRAGHVEDVVVDSEYRGQGIGKKIMKALIATARTKNVSRIELTSGVDRIVANALYEKMGFKLRKTNAYSLAL